MLRGTRTGFLPEIIQTPFRAQEALLLARFLVPQSHFFPPHTASSCQIKPSVVCDRQLKLHSRKSRDPTLDFVR